jgi:hypothetical protein
VSQAALTDALIFMALAMVTVRTAALASRTARLPHTAATTAQRDHVIA